LVRRIFRDIDPDGFLGKILSISGWPGIRNRLAAVYIEYAMTGRFPESANLSLVTDIVNMKINFAILHHLDFPAPFFWASMLK